MATFLTKMAPKMTRVLFCGNEFTWSYQFTKEALAKHTDIEVCFGTNLSSMPLPLCAAFTPAAGAQM